MRVAVQTESHAGLLQLREEAQVLHQLRPSHRMVQDSNAQEEEQEEEKEEEKEEEGAGRGGQAMHESPAGSR